MSLFYCVEIREGGKKRETQTRKIKKNRPVLLRDKEAIFSTVDNPLIRRIRHQRKETVRLEGVAFVHVPKGGIHSYVRSHERICKYTLEGTRRLTYRGDSFLVCSFKCHHVVALSRSGRQIT